jgi:hypothetical protein
MASRPTKGRRQVNLELASDLIDRTKEFARGRGETLTDVVTWALERHMANPPVLQSDVPLPPLAPPKKGKK